MAKWIKIDDICERLTPKEARLWVALLILADHEGRVSTTNSDLCQMTGLSRQEIRTMLKQPFKQPIFNQFINQLPNQLGAKGKTNLIISNIDNYIVQRKPYFRGANQLANQLANHFSTNSLTNSDNYTVHVDSTTILPVSSVKGEKEFPPTTPIITPPIQPTVVKPPSSSPPSPPKKVKAPKIEYAPGVKLTEEEHGRLVEEFGAEFTKGCIDYLADYKVEKSYKNKDDNLTIRRWVIDAYRRQQNERTRSAAPVARQNTTQHNKDVLQRFSAQLRSTPISPDEQ